jgi:hypothetical protein
VWFRQPGVSAAGALFHGDAGDGDAYAEATELLGGVVQRDLAEEVEVRGEGSLLRVAIAYTTVQSLFVPKAAVESSWLRFCMIRSRYPSRLAVSSCAETWPCENRWDSVLDRVMRLTHSIFLSGVRTSQISIFW